MAVDIVIPALGESITEGTILRWLKNAGEAVERDEIVIDVHGIDDLKDRLHRRRSRPRTGGCHGDRGMMDTRRFEGRRTVRHAAPLGRTLSFRLAHLP